MGLNKTRKIFLAGHSGLVGSSILKYFKEKQYKRIFTIGRSKLDLTNQFKTEKYLKYIKPDFVHVLMGGKIIKSGGPDLALELEKKGYENFN